MSHTVLEPEIVEADTANGRWMVVIYNNDVTPMEDVMEVLMAATGCDEDEAYMEMWEAHTFGKAPVHFASKEECTEAARIIQSAGITTEVKKEWDD